MPRHLLWTGLVLAACAAPHPLPPASPPRAAALPSDASPTGILVVRIHGLRQPLGFVRIAVFGGPEGFPSDRGRALATASVEAKGTSATAELKGLLPGVLAVAAFHDEDADGALGTNLFGIPIEGFGASRDPPPGFGPPSFDQAKLAFEPPRQELDLNLVYF